MLRTLTALFTLACTTATLAADYDVLVRGGTIYDGTGAPPYAADVAIRDDRIVAIGRFEDADADRVIDASGLAVAPGFFYVARAARTVER